MSIISSRQRRSFTVKRYSMLKRFLACALSAAVCLGLFSYTSSGNDNIQTASAVSEEARQNEQNISDTQKTLDELLEKQKQLDSQINATQGDISKEEENQKAIASQIETVQKTILALEESIKQLNTQISDLQTDIEQSEIKIIEKKEEIDQGTEDFKKRLRAMYIVGDSSYSSIIAGATDFYDMLMKMELVKRVANHDNDMIDKLISLKAQYEADKKVLEGKKADLEENKNSLLKQQKDHEGQRSKLQELMDKSKELVKKLEQQKADYEKNKKKIDQDQSKFEDELKKLYDQRAEIAAKEEAERIRKEREAAAAAEAERQRQLAEQQRQQQQQTQQPVWSQPTWSQPTTIGLGSGKFIWPVPGYYGITSEFGPRWGSNHNGMDISSWGIAGQNFVAAAAGTVIRVENYCPHNYGKSSSCGCGGGYGRYCIVDHGNGLWSLYGHATNISVSVGQTVNAGDVLGQVGSTGWSTGAHLHFEVRLYGTAVNPRNYL